LGWMRAGRSKILEFESALHHSGGASAASRSPIRFLWEARNG
jgi:hypothetical protein